MLGPIRSRLRFIARDAANTHGVAVAERFLAFYRGVLNATREVAGKRQLPNDAPLKRMEEADGILIPAKRIAQRIEFGRACEWSETHTLAKYDFAAASHISRMMQRANNYLGSKDEVKPPELQNHTTLYEYFESATKQLERIITTLAERFEQTSQEEDNERNQSLFPSNWSPEKYDDQINRALISYSVVGAAPGDEQRFDLDKLSEQVLAQLRDDNPRQFEDVRTLTNLIDYWFDNHLQSDNDILKLTETIARACRAILFKAGLDLSAFFEGSVIDQLMIEYKEDERRHKLTRLVRAAAPYLTLDIQSQASMTNNYQPIYNNLLGKRAGDINRSADNETELLGEVTELARDLDRRAEWKLSSLDAEKTTIVLCREVWGIPLQYYDKLGFLHDAYRQTRDVDSCHIDYRHSWEDLPDVRNVDPHIYSHIRDNVDNILFAMIRGTITCRKDDGAFIVKVPDKFSGVDIVKVGSRLARIIRKVCEEEAVREFLQKDRVEWEDKATVKHWAAVYASALLTYEISRKEIEQEDDKRSAPLRNCFRMLLTRFRRRLMEEGPEGERWIERLRSPNGVQSDIDRDRQQAVYDRLLSSGLLFRSSEDVPVHEVDADKLDELDEVVGATE